MGNKLLNAIGNTFLSNKVLKVILEITLVSLEFDYLFDFSIKINQIREQKMGEN